MRSQCHACSRSYFIIRHAHKEYFVCNSFEARHDKCCYRQRTTCTSTREELYFSMPPRWYEFPIFPCCRRCDAEEHRYFESFSPRHIQQPRKAPPWSLFRDKTRLFNAAAPYGTSEPHLSRIDSFRLLAICFRMIITLSISASMSFRAFHFRLTLPARFLMMTLQMSFRRRFSLIPQPPERLILIFWWFSTFHAR